MSILIKGMEMPKEGSCVQIVIDDDGKVYPSVDRCIMQIGSYATAIPVPPHGDLIDRDALMAEYERDEKAADEHGREFSFSFKSGGANCTEWWPVQQKLFYAPTIIPADKEGETSK